jgi:hypothetical protein
MHEPCCHSSQVQIYTITISRIYLTLMRNPGFLPYQTNHDGKPLQANITGPNL